jgi:hypothetical protein
MSREYKSVQNNSKNLGNKSEILVICFSVVFCVTFREEGRPQVKKS